MKILKKFYSKKNFVCLLEDNQTMAVYKLFSDRENYLKEKNYYQVFHDTNLAVPALLASKNEDCSILLEYLNDETALDCLEFYEKYHDLDKASELLISIFQWLESFHQLDVIKSKNLSFYDMNLRNFILLNTVVYGVDFESIQKGDLLSDTAKLIGMYLNYDEKYSSFKLETVARFKHFIEKEGCFETDTLEKTISTEIVAINDRRNLKTNMI
ncbi:MAG TPA: hypothetical protein DCG34_10260 [Clostridiales bacterium]|nr:hypothetical protein [Clostridiales bacterium]